MRTTLDIDDAVLAAARTLAAERGVSLGEAVSQLARLGLMRQASVSLGGLPTFDVREGASAITPEMVREANEDL